MESGQGWFFFFFEEINSNVCITIPNILSLNYLLKKVKFGYVDFNSIKTERNPRSCLGTVITLTMRAAGGPE